jgi:hypothetical protein
MPWQLAFEDVKGGMNAADPPNKIATNQVARSVNCRILDGFLTTRCGTRAIPLSGAASEFVARSNNQGSFFFNPAKGQGGLILGDDNSNIALAVGGRKFIVNIEGRHANSRAIITEITNGLLTNSQLHLVWWNAWENILIAQDGNSNAFVWDGIKPAVFSPGYNSINKLRSEIPNGGTVMSYVHGRGVVVVNSRLLLVGDNLHRTDQSSSENLREFTEQVYWATGQYFLPPSSMGGINAAAVLPQRNTVHGHGDLMLHCEDGVFSIDLNVFPRTKWAETPMVKHAMLASGAAGPYAVAIYDGDQLFRTLRGVQTLRSAAANSQLEGNPEQTISNAVDTWLKADYKRWLRFASVDLWSSAHRFFVTTSPIVQGRFRWHRGLIVRNADPSLSESNTPPAWEGCWTLPPQSSGIVQFVNGLFDAEERQFAWTRGNDGRNRLTEFSETLREDVLEDGTRHRIRAQVITRAIDAGEWWKKREFTKGLLFLRNIVGVLEFGVWFRPLESKTWIPWQAGRIEAPELGDEGDLSEGDPQPAAIPLGDMPKACVPAGNHANESRSVQFLVRWAGYCSLEGIRIEHGIDDLTDDTLKNSGLNVTFLKATGDNYSDFEYAESDEPDWITQ